ncbi:hypothetical protein G5V59_26430 [Nocardioides sp. W3-2-3]|uniref:hypothetical protein n=1 Tax=Nocardioides convexus TaxID=2712224 RepID=UPI0024185740|nr:hypothetical protein [Nocardioides convexus]NHA01966.1 hypothetical protein [Nocardioides convexus]
MEARCGAGSPSSGAVRAGRGKRRLGLVRAADVDPLQEDAGGAQAGEPGPR